MRFFEHRIAIHCYACPAYRLFGSDDAWVVDLMGLPLQKRLIADDWVNAEESGYGPRYASETRTVWFCPVCAQAMEPLNKTRAAKAISKIK